MKEKMTPLRIVRLVFGLALITYVFTRGKITSWLPFYTIQTNLMVGAWFTLAGIMPEREQKHTFWMKDAVKGSVTTYITITGLVYNLVLIPYEVAHYGRISTTSIITHMIVPTVMILDYLFTSTKENPKWSQLYFWLVYPLLYAAGTLIRAAFTGFWPYPFIDPAQANSTPQLIVNYIAVLAAHVGLAALYLAIARKKWTKKNG